MPANMLEAAVAGIDVGHLTAKAVIFRDGTLLGKAILTSSDGAESGARMVLEQALIQSGLAFSDLASIVVTGAGRGEVTIPNKQKSIAACLSKGIYWLFPDVRTVFDVGAESSTTVRISKLGALEDSIGNDRCASGSGTFLESVADRLMHMSLEEMAQLSLQATRRAEINNMCAVFAEQEIISQVHRVPPTPVPEIIAGVHGSMAERIVGTAKRVGIEPAVALCGGVALNAGFVKVMEEELEQNVIIPQDPQFVAALGAALIAWQQRSK